jgi:hypothetical protein
MSLTGRKVGQRLKDIAVVMRLDEFAPVGGRATSGRDPDDPQPLNGGGREASKPQSPRSNRFSRSRNSGFFGSRSTACFSSAIARSRSPSRKWTSASVSR